MTMPFHPRSFMTCGVAAFCVLGLVGRDDAAPRRLNHGGGYAGASAALGKRPLFEKSGAKTFVNAVPWAVSMTTPMAHS
jgi:hypothetical protein